jgi:hypothetical protein
VVALAFTLASRWIIWDTVASSHIITFHPPFLRHCHLSLRSTCCSDIRPVMSQFAKEACQRCQLRVGNVGKQC